MQIHKSYINTHLHTHLFQLTLVVHTVRLQFMCSALTLFLLLWTRLNRSLCVRCLVCVHLTVCGRHLLWLCDLVCICVGRCDFERVNREGEYQWLPAAPRLWISVMSHSSLQTCSRFSMNVLSAIWCVASVSHKQNTFFFVCVCVNSCENSVCILNILCGSFSSGETKCNCDNSMLDALWSVFNICQEEKGSQVLLVFPLLRLEDYWLFTQGAGLAHCTVLDQKFI